MSKSIIGTICIVCNTPQRHMFNYQEYDYYRCPTCAHVTTYPFPDKQTIEAHYANKFATGNYQLLMEFSEEYKQVYDSYVSLLDKQFALDTKRLDGLKILDVGCFTGGFLQLLQSRGADVYGLELQGQAVEIANRKMPGRIFQADIESRQIPQMEFDIVSLLAVIEHVVDPVRLLKQAGERLKPGGILLLQTPNSGSLLARATRGLWPPYAPVEHIHIFSKRSLISLLQKSGFVNIAYRAHFKQLPLNYVYDMMRNYGPEFRRFISPLYSLLPEAIKHFSFPFYVGEMIVLAHKPKTAD